MSRSENLDKKKFMMCVVSLGLKSILSRAENLDQKKFMMCVVCWVSSQY